MIPQFFQRDTLSSNSMSKQNTDKAVYFSGRSYEIMVSSSFSLHFCVCYNLFNECLIQNQFECRENRIEILFCMTCGTRCTSLNIVLVFAGLVKRFDSTECHLFRAEWLDQHQRLMSFLRSPLRCFHSLQNRCCSLLVLQSLLHHLFGLQILFRCQSHHPADVAVFTGLVLPLFVVLLCTPFQNVFALWLEDRKMPWHEFISVAPHETQLYHCFWL